jgi:hypothetical protein
MPYLERAGQQTVTTRRHPKHAGWMGVAAAARALHMTRSGVEYLIRKGALSFEKDSAGIHWFDPAEIKACAAARGIEAPYNGQTCRRVFEMFDEGRTLPDIVKELAILPEQVRKLWLEYRTPLGKDVVKLNRLLSKDDKKAEEEHKAMLAELDGRLAEAAGVVPLTKDEPSKRKTG